MNTTIEVLEAVELNTRDASIIALRGKKGSGKSTAAAIIEALLWPRKTQAIGFADPIKQFCGFLFELSEPALWGPSAERERVIEFTEARADRVYSRAKARTILQFEVWGRSLGRDLLPALPAFWRWLDAVTTHSRREGLTARHVLQTFGTDFGREHFGADVWADLAIAQARKHAEFRGAVTLITDCRFDNEVRAVRAAGGLVIQIVNTEAPQQSDAHASEQGGTEAPDYCIENTPSAGIEALRTALITCLSQSRI